MLGNEKEGQQKKSTLSGGVLAMESINFVLTKKWNAARYFPMNLDSERRRALLYSM